nr:sigma-70 family RNA polymerase sigma factor [Sphingomonas sp. Y57]
MMRIAPDSVRRREIATWVGVNIMPHEAKVRLWLKRARVSGEDVDDLIQEAYCKLAGLETVEHIDRPDAYFFSLARNLLVRKLKRAAIVPFTTIAEIEAYDDDRPSPEREVAARREVERVRLLIARLPDRCRRIFEMRRIQGLSQKEIARAEGVSEGMVEYHVHQGVRALVRAMREEEGEADALIGRAIKQGKKR